MSAIDKVIEQFPYGDWATRRRFITGLIFLVVFSITYLSHSLDRESAQAELAKLIGFKPADLLNSPQTVFIAAIIVFAVGSIADAMIDGYIVRGVSISMAAFDKCLVAPSKNWHVSLRGIWWIFIIFSAFIFLPLAILACTVLNSLGSDKELETIGLPLARVGLMDSDECLLSDKALEFYRRLSPSIQRGLDQLYGDQSTCAWQRLMDSVPEHHRIWVSRLNARSRDLASFTASAMFSLILSFLVIPPLNWWGWFITYSVIFFLSYLLLGCAKIHQPPLENRHAQALRVGEVDVYTRPEHPRSCQHSRCESSALHREPMAACLRSSVVGYFRRLGQPCVAADAVDRRRLSKPSCPAWLSCCVMPLDSEPS